MAQDDIHIHMSDMYLQVQVILVTSCACVPNLSMASRLSMTD